LIMGGRLSRAQMYQMDHDSCGIRPTWLLAGKNGLRGTGKNGLRGKR
jgi:hypothetical protein